MIIKRRTHISICVYYTFKDFTMQEATHMLYAYSRSGIKEKRVTSKAISSLYPLHALPGKCGGDRTGDGCVFSF